MKTSAVA